MAIMIDLHRTIANHTVGWMRPSAVAIGSKDFDDLWANFKVLARKRDDAPLVDSEQRLLFEGIPVEIDESLSPKVLARVIFEVKR